jgi:hypothetical protein
MKPISFEMDECPMDGEVTPEGHFTFYVYVSNYTEGELEDTIPVLAELWNSESVGEAEVTLTLNMKLRDLFTSAVDSHGDYNNVIDAEAMPVFNALRQDCQWILDQIAQLKFAEETHE